MNATARTTVLRSISYDAKNRTQLFLVLALHEQAEVLLLLSKQVRLRLLEELSNEQIVEILNHLDPDDATDVIQQLSKKRQQHIVNQLSEHLQTSISLLLNFDPETAAGLMNIDYVLISSDATSIAAAQAVRRHEKRTGKIPTMLVVDEGKLRGELPSQSRCLLTFAVIHIAKLWSWVKKNKS